ncbi:MAG: sodium:proton antiporter [bacterium]
MHIYLLCLGLFALGTYCLVVKRHMIKKIIGLVTLDYGINLFFILLGYKKNGISPFKAIAPILQDSVYKDPSRYNEFLTYSVDPLPQALVLTSIVIGLGTLALMASLAIKLYEKYGTFDISEIRKLRG